MQLNTNINQLDSREYKLILDSSVFSAKDKSKDKYTILDILEGRLTTLNLTFEKQDDDPKIKKSMVFR